LVTAGSYVCNYSVVVFLVVWSSKCQLGAVHVVNSLFMWSRYEYSVWSSYEYSVV